MSKMLLRFATWATKRLYERIYGERVEHVAFYCPGTVESRAQRAERLLKELISL